MIVAMKKAYIACLAQDRQALIDALFSLEKIMLVPLSEASDISEAKAKFDESQKLLSDIQSYEKKKGMLDSLPEVAEDEFANIDPQTIELSSELREKLDLLSEKKSLVTEEKRRLEELSPWLLLTNSIEELSDTEFTSILVGTIPSGRVEEMKSKLDSSQVSVLGEKNSQSYLFIVCERIVRQEVLSKAADIGFVQCELPIKEGKIYDEYVKVGEEYSENTKQIEDLSARIRELALQKDKLSILSEQYKASLEKQSAPALSTDETVYIEGWICEEDEETVRKAVCQAVPDAAIEFCDPSDDDIVPTATKNNKIVSQFEEITNMFSVPSNKELDPNPIMAPWYWIIFGMMMGDVGYGFIMLLGGLLFKILKKPKGGTRRLVNIITMSGITTMIFGFVFNSFFCFSINGLPSYSIVDIQNPANSHILEWMIISACIGFLHMFTALITNMYVAFKSRDPLTAIADNLSWIFIFSGIALLVVGMMKVPSLKTVGLIVALVGAGLILVFGGRKKKGLGKITGGLLSLYGITGFVSDALSYTRIIALAISTGIIGFVMNTLAEKVIGIPIAGYIFAGLIYIIGHAFNVIMGLLSAYVHDSRLQFIEFFGHFFTGGGLLFSPFKREVKTVEIISKKSKKKA